MPEITYSIPLKTITLSWTIAEQAEMIQEKRERVLEIFREIREDIKAIGD
jgi:hypothetical protein